MTSSYRPTSYRDEARAYRRAGKRPRATISGEVRLIRLTAVLFIAVSAGLTLGATWREHPPWPPAVETAR